MNNNTNDFLEGDMKKGQLVEISYKHPGGWEYGVVSKIYDDRCLILKEYGGRLMCEFTQPNSEKNPNEQWLSDDVKVAELFVDGKPVMAKKNLLGGYKFL
ncbi:hypothetical protein PC41400_15040 [Paenibacillus chitinolyticus]|uniref:Uncharacterized protein n=2 Tax=Paenibacillus chitinolyticus TaxID=79263 RepID=A0A410WXF4_9BACL|nr:hypothetical protein PC41400_15040 [Paenibacillus chitinolyticus]